MSNKIILVVDDNIEICSNLKDILELKGYKVFTANDGFQALAVIKNEKVDFILLDIKMPLMDGLETFRNIRNINKNAAVIMMTAYALDELIKTSLHEGVFGVIKKPINFDKLFDILDKAVHKGKLLFLVDDDKNLTENLKEILTEKKYAVTVSENGLFAVEKAKEERHDIILIDMKLPPYDGFETYLSIKEFRPDAVVIIITGFIEEYKEIISKAVSRGAHAVFEKPINIDELLITLEKVNPENIKR